MILRFTGEKLYYMNKKKYKHIDFTIQGIVDFICISQLRYFFVYCSPAVAADVNFYNICGKG